MPAVTTKLTAQRLGTWFQDKVQEVLEKYRTSKKADFYRLYDTGSAGTFLPAQPGDFFGSCNGTGWLLEAKASRKHGSLASPGCLRNNIKSNQATSQMLWNKCGRGMGVFVFYSEQSHMVEVWSGVYTARIYHTPRARLQSQYCIKMPFDNMEAGLLRILHDGKKLNHLLMPKELLNDENLHLH